MRHIMKLACEVRNALDLAKANHELLRQPVFCQFPYGCCDLACDLLGQYLLENGIRTEQMNGACKYEPKWRHVWLVTADDTVIDITGDQIRAYGVIGEPVHVGGESEVQALFSLDRKQENNFRFITSPDFDGYIDEYNIRVRNLSEVYRIVNNIMNDRK